MPKVKKMVLADSASAKLARLKGRDYVLSELNRAIVTGLTSCRTRTRVELDLACAGVTRAVVLEMMVRRGCSQIRSSRGSRKGTEVYSFNI